MSTEDSKFMIHLSDEGKQMIRKEASLRQGASAVELAAMLLPALTNAVARVMQRTPGVETLGVDAAGGAVYDVHTKSSKHQPEVKK